MAQVHFAEERDAVEEEWGLRLREGALAAAAAAEGDGGSERQQRAGGAEAELPALVRVDGVPGTEQGLPRAATPLVGRVDGGQGLRVLLRMLRGATGCGDEEQCGGSGCGDSSRGCGEHEWEALS